MKLVASVSPRVVGQVEQEMCETPKMYCMKAAGTDASLRVVGVCLSTLALRRRQSVGLDESKQPRAQPEPLYKLTVCPCEVRKKRSEQSTLLAPPLHFQSTSYRISIPPSSSLSSASRLKTPDPALISPLLFSQCATDIPATTNVLTLRSSGTIAPRQRLIWRRATKRLAGTQHLHQPSRALCLALSRTASSQTRAEAGYAVNATRDQTPRAGVPLP